MSATATYIPTPREPNVTLRDIITVESTLTELLAEEADLMDAMQLTKVGALQERKLKLTGLLERYMRYASQHPEMLANVSADDKADLRKTAEEFQRVMKRNYDTLLVARAVNKTVVKCVTQVVTRKEQNPVYNAMGRAKAHYRPLPISITLNETV